MSETIYALSTGPLPSGVAVVRISGPHVGAVMSALVPGPTRPRQAMLRTIRVPDSDDVIDQGLVIHYPSPHSFTGEDVLELHLHGSRAILRLCFESLAGIPGLRPAQPGEFSRRAFLNGKLDLVEAEGLADLISAETDAQRRQALAQALGGLSRVAEDWRVRLLDVMANLAATLDFADEADVAPSSLGAVVDDCLAIAAGIRRALTQAERAHLIRNGFTVLLAGRPNAGKSSLLNALARRDVAIVTPHAGTTRDLIEVGLDLGGFAVTVVDTAGIRPTTDPVEMVGIARTMKRAEHADLVLWLAELDEDVPPAPFEESIRVRTKVDVQPGALTLGVSTKTGDGLDDLIGFLTDQAKAACSGEPALVTHERQRFALRQAAEALERCDIRLPVEILAECVRNATYALDELLGRIDVEEVLGVIFGRFCVGK